jgi:peroxiredoxin
MARASPPPQLKRLLLCAVAGVLTVGLGAGYLYALRPAHARELQAACRGLLPSANQQLGKLPRSAPDFTAQGPGGASVHLADYRGKVVLLNFWASWCQTCEAEKASIEELQRRYSPDDLVVLKVASDSDWKKVQARFPDGTPLTLLLDPPAEDGEVGPIARSWGVAKVPESFLIDREGVVRHYFVNKREWTAEVVGTCLRSVLDEA